MNCVELVQHDSLVVILVHSSVKEYESFDRPFREFQQLDRFDKHHDSTVQISSKLIGQETEATIHPSCLKTTGIFHKNDTPWKILNWLLTVAFSCFIIYYWNESYVGRDNACTWKHSKSARSFDFLFQLGSKHVFEFKVYPFSIKTYFNDIDNGTNHKNELMKYEWARYETYKTFPVYSVLSTLRLAQAGFYYSGRGEEVVCFCCGLKNKTWTEEETVIELHKRLSPNCKLINGEDTSNVPIHGTDEQFKEVYRNESEQATGGASCGPGDINTSRRGIHRDQSTSQFGILNYPYQIIEPKSEHIDTTAITRHSPTHVETTNPERRLFGHFTSNHPTAQIEHFPGITNERPKHPDYAIKSVRLSSFSQWPAARTITPEDLAVSGFFYTGVRDCVRCFFCGGGMKDLEYNDSPWIEHARWFPNCVYVKQCKGGDFINMCRMANINHLPDEHTQSSQELQSLNLQEATIAEDQQIEDLNSIAAKRLLDMGYARAHVEDAIIHARRHYNTTELKAQHLLEYLLDNSFTRTIPTRQQSEHRHESSGGRSPAPITSQSNRTPASVTQQRSAHCSPSSNNRSQTTLSDISQSIPSSTGSVSTGSIHKSQNHERQMLIEENQQLKEQMMCKICMDKDANIVFLPCGHMVACVECAHALRKCAVCRTIIQGTVRAFPA